MALTNSYVQVYGQLKEFFSQISQASAPEKFTSQLLKDWGYGSSNFRAAIPLLKALGFLSPDGSPTSRYQDYRNTALAKSIMAAALREAYSDLFTIKAKPSAADRELIEGKFKSAHNSSPNIAKLMASTFYALLELADLDLDASAKKPSQTVNDEIKPPSKQDQLQKVSEIADLRRPSLHYNIQIHLPATKDIEVFNAIFKSLKEHLID